MADKSTIKIKRSSTSIAPALLNTGELAYTFGTASEANQGGRLFVGGMGTNSDLQSALGAPIVIGGKYFTDIIDAATSVGTIGTLVKRDGTNMAYLNITGNVTSTGLSSFSNAVVTGGSINGTIIGATTAAAIIGTTINGTVITATTNFAGNITGNLTGNSAGTHTGAVVGNVTGDLTGDIYASNGTSKILEAGTDGTNAIFYGSVSGGIIGNVTGNLTGDIYATDGITKILDNGTGLNATFTGSVTGNVTGNLTGNSAGVHTGAVVGNASTATKWASPINATFSGDASTPTFTIDGSTTLTPVLTLATVLDGTTGKIPGTFGSATTIPVVSVNAKGLVTGITTANVATTLSFRGDAAGTVGELNLLTDSLRIVGSGGVTTSIDNATNTITVAMSGTGSLGALSVTGNVAAGTISVEGALEAGETEVSNITVNGNAVITGNLTVEGITTTVNSTTVAIGDKNITLASIASNGSEANGGGITVNGPTIPAEITYGSTDDSWNVNKKFNAALGVYGILYGNADTATKWAAPINISFVGDVTAPIFTVDGSTARTPTLTLATVNTNVGSFGTTLTIPQITVNGKGLITAVSNQTIPNASTTTKGLAFFDAESFGVNAATGYVTLATVDGGTY